MDKETLIKIFSDFRPDCKEKTCKQYAMTLSKISKDINKDKDYNGDEYLENPQLVFDYLANKGSAKSTQANVLSTIIIYLDSKKRDTTPYKKQKYLLDESIELHYNSGKPTELQINNWTSLKSINDMVGKLDSLCDEPMGENASYNETWTRKEMEQVRLLFHLLLKHPSRNEYGCLQFISYRNFKKLMPQTIDKNYIVIRSGKDPQLVISQYKTQKTYGLKETFITDKFLKKLIMKTYKKIGQEYLFTYPKKQSWGGCWSNNYVSQMLAKWTSQMLGKNISSTILYKIIIHELGVSYDQSLKTENWELAEKVKEKLQEYAKSRGHSFKIQKKVYHTPNHE